MLLMPCCRGMMMLLRCILLDGWVGWVQYKHDLKLLHLQVVKLTSFAPFKNAAHALDEVNAISEAVVTDDLKNFLEVNLPKVLPLLLLYLSHLEIFACHLVLMLCVQPILLMESKSAQSVQESTDNECMRTEWS